MAYNTMLGIFYLSLCYVDHKKYKLSFLDAYSQYYQGKPIIFLLNMLKE